MKPILILGGGLAGVTCAVKLKELGYEVVLISKKRYFSAVEGLSQRALEGLQRANLKNTFNAIGTKVPRYATWNKEVFKKNYEFIVERDFFDSMLLKDAREQGVNVIEAKGELISTQPPIVKVEDNIICGKFLVDARGRFAPRNSQHKSLPTTSFLVRHETSTENTPQTSLATSKYGWIWKAKHKNFIYFQLTTSPKNGKKHLYSLLKDTSLPKDSKIVARDASSYMAKGLVEKNYIKIGDCACAVDPLSGNGLFQALSSALIAPFVIHTLLCGTKEDKKAATTFFTEKVEDIFKRYTTTGKYFYAKETSYQTPFWTQRALWPKELKQEMLHEPKIQTKAILQAPFIKKHDVIITNDSPMGIWRLGRVNLVSLVKLLLETSKTKREETILTFASNNNLLHTEIKHLLHWCRKNNLLPSHT